MTKLYENFLSKVQIVETENYDPLFLLEKCFDFLSKEEKLKQDKISNSEFRTNFLVSRYLLRSMLSDFDDSIDPKDWAFEVGQFGKPHLDNQRSIKNLHFNLSHTKGYVACMVAEGYECGVDIQLKNKNILWESISKEVLSFDEYESIKRIKDVTKKENLFYHYWVAKESLLKAKGVGLTEDMKDHFFSISKSDDGNKEIYYSRDPLSWKCMTKKITPSCFLGISLKVPPNIYSEEFEYVLNVPDEHELFFFN